MLDKLLSIEKREKTMQKYNKHTSVAAVLDRANVDTDQIIPKQFLKKVERSGFGIHLFHDWRFNADGSDNIQFELNHPQLADAKILIAGDNFGCGSSREHAPWAISDYGFNTIIATSFADIFYNNCFKNGILPIVLDRQQVRELMQTVQNNLGSSLTIDLAKQQVIAGNDSFSFSIDEFRKTNLLLGLDDIGNTLKHRQKISDYETTHKQLYPWLWL